MMSVLASLYLGTALLLLGTGSSSSLTEAKRNDYSVVEWVSKDSANWVSKVWKAIRYAAECLQDMTYVFIRETCRDMESEECVRVVDKVWNVYSYYGGAPTGLDYVCQEVVYPIIRIGAHATLWTIKTGAQISFNALYYTGYITYLIGHQAVHLLE